MIISNQQDNEMEHLNKKIQTVAVLGAGAVGCYLIAGLAPKLGENLWIIAEGSRKERLENEGLIINDGQLSLCVKTPEEAKGADLLIVAVKYGSLEGSLDAIEQIVDDETIVMSVMNGVDSEEIIGHRIGMQHMMYSMIKIASERTGHCVRFNPEVTEGVYFGEADGSLSWRVAAIENLFNDSGVRFHISEDILKKIRSYLTGAHWSDSMDCSTASSTRTQFLASCAVKGSFPCPETILASSIHIAR